MHRVARRIVTKMPKRAASTEAAKSPVSKKARTTPSFKPNKVATPENAAAVDADPPFARLVKADVFKTPAKGDAVVYYMRMGDLRSAFTSIYPVTLLTPHTVNDNRALSQASEQAKKEGIHLVVLFVLSPQDYVAHDRGSRRVDFVLRNLRQLKVRQ